MKILNDETYQELVKTIKDRKKDIKPFMIAIDGRCTSGKSSLALRLAEDFHASVVHMDDFFLRISFER